MWGALIFVEAVLEGRLNRILYAGAVKRAAQDALPRRGARSIFGDAAISSSPRAVGRAAAPVALSENRIVSRQAGNLPDVERPTDSTLMAFRSCF
jgi:hypothetical protein